MEEKQICHYSEYIGSNEDADIFLRQLLNIGEAMYRAGGEIHRIEESLHRLGKAYGAEHTSVYALTSSIVITIEFKDNYSLTQSRRILRRESMDLYKLEQLNQLCRDCTSKPLPLTILREKVLTILEEPVDIRWTIAGSVIAALGFTLFFGGNVADSLIAAIGALIIVFMQTKIRPVFSAFLFFNLVTSFITGAFISLCGLLITGLHVDKIMIGDIMVLIPGIAITSSIRYILSGDTISSLEKLIDSLLQAFAIAIGFILSLHLVNPEIISPVADTSLASTLLKILFAWIGTIGFCLIFHTDKKSLVSVSVGGMLCWSAFVLFRYLGLGVFLSTFLATLCSGVYSEIFSHGKKIPTTVYFIPAAVPLIPGSNLYYSTFAFLSSDWSSFTVNITLLAIYAFGIAMGLASVLEAEHVIKKLLRKTKKA